ncbi:hypothetical protein [Croceicoccus mobilis]|uniref:hypothetical protein n=1 Tax=Croceicoccus mobilis TaxID=1703339 RepID=UPI0012E8216F|nr:hypothetical protein [Croceicoccus mobilis]
MTILSGDRTLAQADFPQHINMAAQGEGFAIGQDYELKVTGDYADNGAFPGSIHKVVVGIGLSGSE